MSDETPLSALCGICHGAKPKYRCPGCMSQTCSLTCYKKHQQRAPCSGKRNPAKYVKKSKLATPAGFDHDYNYLKSVEAEIARAAANVEQHGIDSSSAATVKKNILRGRHHNSALQRYLIQNRIHVENAPIGMHRQRINQTRPTKRNNIFWSIEWIDGSGEKTLQHDCLESSTVAALYDAHVAEKRQPPAAVTGTAIASAATTGSGKKRKRQDIVASTSTTTQTPTESTVLDAEVASSPPASVTTSTTISADDTIDDSSSPKGTTTTTTSNERHFYLLRPSTATRTPVVIPITNPHQTTLTEALRDRTVLEFPTIVVLPSDANDLAAIPDTYILEATYEAARRQTSTHKGQPKGIASALEARPSLSSSTAEARTALAHANKEVDAQSILDMLKRDGFS